MKIALALLAALALAACARDDAAYPSLAPRATEARGFAEPAVAPPPVPTADPALDAKVAELGGRLDAIAEGFDADAGRAEAAAGAAGARAVGSEAWIDGQQRLAALDDRRAEAGGLATEIDGLARERTETVGAPYPALDALNARAAAEAERETAAIAALNRKLPTP